MSRAIRLLRMTPTLFRVGFAEQVAYRAEILIWVLSYTMPLVMLALWSAVAEEAPVGRYDQAGFAAYFIVTLLVRMVVACWVVWEMNEDIKSGGLARRLLKPIHPVFAYGAANLSALPMRFILAAPIVTVGLLLGGASALSTDPLQWAMVPLVLFMAWMMTFLVQALIGSLAFFWEKSLSAFDLYMGIYVVASGYVMPLDLIPEEYRGLVDALPFRYMLATPVEAILGLVPAARTLHDLGVMAAWCGGLLVVMLTVFHRGLRRYAAFGG